MLILASSSPRRREILETVGAKFRVMPSQIDEAMLPAESADSYVVRLARDKARDVARRLPDGFVIGADTVVVHHGKVLGKPAGLEDARTMLRQLSNNWHDVLTGVAVVNAATGREAADVCKTRVKFAPLSGEEIEWYLKSGEPFDKAGGYAIQGRGSLFIEKIEGNYLNVVGLPVTLLSRLLASLGGTLV